MVSVAERTMSDTSYRVFGRAGGRVSELVGIKKEYPESSTMPHNIIGRTNRRVNLYGQEQAVEAKGKQVLSDTKYWCRD